LTGIIRKFDGEEYREFRRSNYKSDIDLVKEKLKEAGYNYRVVYSDATYTHTIYVKYSQIKSGYSRFNNLAEEIKDALYKFEMNERKVSSKKSVSKKSSKRS
jgi:hypothetical protein